MNHFDIERNCLIKGKDGNVLAMDIEKAELPKIVFTKESVAPEWYNILRASAIMYHELSNICEWLQELIDISEAANGADDTTIKNYIQLQNSILLTQQVAREGAENVVAENWRV